MPLTSAGVGELLAKFTWPTSVVSHSSQALTHFLLRQEILTVWFFVISLCLFTSFPVFWFFQDLNVPNSTDILEPNCIWPAYWIRIPCLKCSSKGWGLAGPFFFFSPHTDGSIWVSALGQNWSVRSATPHSSQWVIKCGLLQPAEEMSALLLGWFFFFS